MSNNLSKNDVIVLDDQKQYVVVDLMIYENNHYAYLCELGNVDNIKFVQLEADNNLSIIDSDEVDLLKKLVLLFSKNNTIFNKKLNVDEII